MELKEQICRELRNYHTGRYSAVHSYELEEKFSVSGRKLRRVISSLRQEGYPICSDSCGYYYAEDQHEINATVGRLNEFVTGVANTRTAMLYTAPDRDAVKIELTVRVTGGR